MILKLTLHARDKMSALAISAPMLKSAMIRGSKVNGGDGKVLAVYTYFTVVYRPLGSGVYKIITVYEHKR